MTLGRAASFEELFPNDLIQTILKLIGTAWKKMVSPLQTDKENPITERLLKSVREEKRRLGNLPFQVHREVWIDEEEDDPSFRMDLTFTYGSDEHVYLGFEAKRVNLPTAKGGVRANAKNYCSKGVLRYIECEYASALPAGGMLAYVMNGQAGRAIIAIERRMAADSAKLRLTVSRPHLANSELLPDILGARQSVHTLTARTFTIHHLFLAV